MAMPLLSVRPLFWSIIGMPSAGGSGGSRTEAIKSACAHKMRDRPLMKICKTNEIAD